MDTENDGYVLLTAACNEEKYITKTIQSVINQTILPKRWVIVSDGSTDLTDEIIKKYALRYEFIRFVRRDKKDERNFASKVLALREGLRLLADVDYLFYCTLDADVSFDPTYFQKILDKFHENPKLGIAGGIVLDYYDNKSHKRIGSLKSVSGAVQFFRRECFTSTGGHVPSSVGGVDTILEIKAKKNGWLVQSFPELHVYHYRRTGMGNSTPLKAKFKRGIRDYCIGKTFLFEFFKCIYRLRERPYIIGAVAWLCGYFLACFKKPAKLLSEDEIAFVRDIQFRKLKKIFRV